MATMNAEEVQNEEAKQHSIEFQQQKSQSVEEKEVKVSAPAVEKATIFVSYSPDAGYVEKKFVMELVKEFKQNGLSSNIWFDKDEMIFESSAWLAYTLEAAEKCSAVCLVLSESYFNSPMCVYVLKTLTERLYDQTTPLGVYTIIYSPIKLEHYCAPFLVDSLTHNIVDINLPDLVHRSINEQVCFCVSKYMIELEQYATGFRAESPKPVLTKEFTGDYKEKLFLTWTVNDLQEWLQSLGIREYYREQFVENTIDGYLAYSLTDFDLTNHLNIDVQVIRRKIIHSILKVLEKEQKSQWYGVCRSAKPKICSVFLISDPRHDIKTTKALKNALLKRSLDVHYIDDMGTSREDFLCKIGPKMAGCAYVLVVLTESTPKSAIVYYSVMFAEWLNRRIITLIFTNSWFELRPAVRAVLYETSGIDFTSQSVSDSMAMLTSVITVPIKEYPNVVLEHGYVKQLSQQLSPTGMLAHASVMSRKQTQHSEQHTNVHHKSRITNLCTATSIYLSYHWDNTDAVIQLRKYLQARGCIVCVDMDKAPDDSNMRAFIESCVQQCHAVIPCVTPRYLQSDNCVNDLEVAHLLRKPIFPVLLQFTCWPPDVGCPVNIRKRLAGTQCVDLSSERMVSKNLHKLLTQINRISNK